MKLVVDANIFFAAFVKNGHTRKLLLLSANELFVPRFLFEEIRNHISELKQKTGLSEEILVNLIDDLFTAIGATVVEPGTFEDKLGDARKISPDPDDVMYLALALKLNCPIWSNDRKLKEQTIVPVFSTTELN